MDSIKEAVVKGLEEGLSKQSQAGISQVVKNLPDLAMNVAPRTTSKILSSAMGGNLNSRRLAKGLSEITKKLDDTMAQQSQQVYKNQGLDGLADLTGRRRGVSNITNKLEDAAKSRDSDLSDIQKAFQDSPEGTEEIARLSLNMGGGSSNLPSWSLPFLGGTGGALIGSQL